MGMLERLKRQEPTIDTYDLNVHYHRTLEEMVSYGKLECTNEYINQINFPMVGKYTKKPEEKIKLSILCFDQQMYFDEESRRWLGEKGLRRHATLEELCSFAESFPKIAFTEDNQIIALGSVWEDTKGKAFDYNHYRCGTFAPLLYLSREKPTLGLTWHKRDEDPWWSTLKFALVGI